MIWQKYLEMGMTIIMELNDVLLDTSDNIHTGQTESSVLISSKILYYTKVIGLKPKTNKLSE